MATGLMHITAAFLPVISLAIKCAFINRLSYQTPEVEPIACYVQIIREKYETRIVG
jgi:hypothetical protein